MKNVKWAFITGVKARPVFMLLIFLSYILLYLLSPLSTVLISYITDTVFEEQVFNVPLLILIIIYILVLSFENIQYSFSMLFIETIDESLSRKLQRAFFEATEKTNLIDLDNPEYLNKMYRGRNITRYVMANMLNDIFHGLGLLVSIIFSCVLIIREAPVLIVPIFLICFIGNITAKRQGVEVIEKDRAVDELQRKLQYDMTLLTGKENIREIRTYGAYDFIFYKWRNKYNEMKKIELLFQKRWALIDTIVSGITIIVDNAIMLFLLYLIWNGKMSIGTLVLITSNKSIITQGIESLIESWIELRNDDSYLKDLREVLGRDDTFTTEKPKDDYILNMENVDFSYFSDIQLIKNMNLHINKGEVVALVGENGSGKSTLAKLAIGLLQADKGIIKVDTDDVSAAYQDFVRFELSLRENVGFGALEYINDDDKIMEAIKKGDSQYIYDFVGNNLSAILGKNFDLNGFELSGGQWQRIAISRSFMGNHSFIVFDEPASALDPLAEMRQFEHIRKQFSMMGGLIISHRVGIARLADYIIYMKDGEIVEKGTHNELLSLGGYYYNFFNAQAQWYSNGGGCKS